MVSVCLYIYVCVFISIYLLFIYLFNGGCKPNYKCGALSCRCLKQVCISVSMPGSEELNISGYWPHAEEKGTLPTLHDVLEGVWPNYIKCRSRGMQYIYIYIYMQPRGSVNEIALQQSFAELTSEPISNTLQVFENVYIYTYYMYEKKQNCDYIVLCLINPLSTAYHSHKA